jgi:Na+-transporting methylmalonyl-CoA/oxaloacetate decarboxylase gamma subunit
MSMSESVAERPAAVTVIGWSSIVLAVLMFLSGAMGLLGAVMMQMMPEEAAAQAPPGLEQMQDMLQYTIPLSFVQLGIAVVMMVGSILLLRLRETGRLMLEALNWFGLVFTIGLSAWFLPMWSRNMAGLAQATPGQQARGMFMMSPAVGATIGVVQVAIIVLIIWVLRSKTVRGAMAG